jgi:hypothetical protein
MSGLTKQSNGKSSAASRLRLSTWGHAQAIQCTADIHRRLQAQKISNINRQNIATSQAHGL